MSIGVISNNNLFNSVSTVSSPQGRADSDGDNDGSGGTRPASGTGGVNLQDLIQALQQIGTRLGVAPQSAGADSDGDNDGSGGAPGTAGSGNGLLGSLHNLFQSLADATAAGNQGSGGQNGNGGKGPQSPQDIGALLHEIIQSLNQAGNRASSGGYSPLSTLATTGNLVNTKG